jgi:hypothetical protein
MMAQQQNYLTRLDFAKFLDVMSRLPIYHMDLQNPYTNHSKKYSTTRHHYLRNRTKMNKGRNKRLILNPFILC